MGMQNNSMRHGGGFSFATHSFTLKEVELLVSVLKENFNLDCTIHKNNDKFRIYIRTKSMPLFTCTQKKCF